MRKKSVFINRFTRPKTVLMNLTKRYLLVFLAIFFMIVAFYYKNTSELYNKQLGNFAVSITKQIAASHDSTISKMQETIYNLPYDTSFQNVLKSYQDGDIQSKIVLMEKANALLNSNTYFSSVYIYMPSNNIVFSTDKGQTFKLDDFYDRDPIVNMGKSSIKTYEPRQVSIANDGSSRSYITISCKVPQNIYDYNGILVVNVDLNVLYRDIVGKYKLNGDSNLYVLNDQNDVIIHKSYAFRNGLIYKANEAEVIPKVTQIKDGYILRDGHIMSMVKSSTSSFKFILDMDIRGEGQTFADIAAIALYALILCLLGIFLLSFLSSRVLRPLRYITEKITQGSAGAFNDESNELEFIDKNITVMQNENFDLKERYREVFPIYRERLLQDLLTTDFYSAEEIQHRLHYYDIQISMENYITMVLLLDLPAYDEKRANIAMIYAKEAINNALQHKFKGFCVEIENNKIGIAINVEDIHICDNNLSEEFFTATVEFGEELVENIKEENGLNITIGIGPYVRDIRDLHRSYKDALGILGYRKTVSRSVITIYQIRKSKDEAYHYPYEKERLLLNFIRVGDSGASSKILKEIFDAMSANELISDSELEYIIMQLFSAINKFTYENQLKGNNEVWARDFLHLIKHKNLKDISREFENYINGVIAEVKGISKNSESRINEILRFIDEKYNKNIQLVDVEETFDLNRYYIGQLIKERTGKNFNDYLNYKRIEKAKELLENSEHSVRQISEMTGYSYPNYFGKMFKQLEGITPGEYRSRILGERLDETEKE